MPNPNRLRCPQCRTRRTDPHLMVLHRLGCERPLCHCLRVPFAHRPGSFPLCEVDPMSDVRKARLEGASPDQLLDIAAEIAWAMPGKGSWDMRERDIEQHLVQRVKELGGEVRKVRWIARRGAPDRLVMLPERPWEGSKTWAPESFWVELKAPGKKPTVIQTREHERMRALGQRVEVIDSLQGVEELLS